MRAFDFKGEKIETSRRVLASLKSAPLYGLKTARGNKGGCIPMPLDYKSNARGKLCPAA